MTVIDGIQDSVTLQAIRDLKTQITLLNERINSLQVQAAISDVLPGRTEVVTGEQVAEETSDAVGQFIDVFGTGLLIFAFITAFVSAFIINNIYGITIGQRLRELALLRSVGANGSQVRRMVARALASSVGRHSGTLDSPRHR